MRQTNYKKRTIAFLDVLGFKEIVKKSIKDEDEKIKLFQVLRYIEQQKNEDENYTEVYSNGVKSFEMSIDNHDRRVTTFSDSIVISYPDDEDGRTTLLWEVVLLQCYMGIKGYLVRGGLARGDLFHEDNIIVGPAMLEAYELESKVANYPRVLLSIDYFEQIMDDESVLMAGLLKQDRDGFNYTNFANFYLEDDLTAFKNFVSRELVLLKTLPGVYAKISWLADYLDNIKK